MRQVNPLYFYFGIFAVAGLPMAIALGMPIETAILGAAVLLAIVLFGIAAPLVARALVGHYSTWGKSKETGVPVCRKCGYDLRASPFRCPECGARVPSTDRLILQYIQRLQKP